MSLSSMPYKSEQSFSKIMFSQSRKQILCDLLRLFVLLGSPSKIDIFMRRNKVVIIVRIYKAVPMGLFA